MKNRLPAKGINRLVGHVGLAAAAIGAGTIGCSSANEPGGDPSGEVGTTSQAASSYPALGAYNANLSQTSVSGISSGAYFATQYEVAFSSHVVGAGIVAGGPYDCAQDSAGTAEMYCMSAAQNGSVISSPVPLSTLESNTRSWANSGYIDPVSNLASHKIFMYSSTADKVVPTVIMDDLQTLRVSVRPPRVRERQHTDGANFAQKAGTKLAAVNAMVNKITSGYH